MTLEPQESTTIEGIYEKRLIPHPVEFAGCIVGAEFGRKLFNLINGFPLDTNKWTKKSQEGLDTSKANK